MVHKGIAILAVVLTSLLAAHGASEKVLYVFQGVPDGSGSTSSLIFDSAGNLYGTTAGGGTYGYGTVFKLSPASGHWNETVLYSFTGSPDGEYPFGGLVMDSAGNLYGTTSQGGLRCSVTTCGLVFKVDPSGTETVIFRFNGADGLRPSDGLIADAKGNLFGTTQDGGATDNGVVFELTPGSSGTWTENVLYSFTGGSGDGATPFDGLVFDKAGNLYGTTYFGGIGLGNGVVFELKPSGRNWKESVLYEFTGGSDGGRPVAGVTMRGGKLYGTTYYDGAGGGNGSGVVFELSPGSSGWNETALYAFNGRTDGHGPETGVIFDKSGNLYGVTFHGGWRYCLLGCGTIFKLAPKSGGGWQETLLYRFNGRGVGDGEYPQTSRLLWDAKGHLYGTTWAGGGTGCYGIGCGVVFELTP
jgi:uncharacterized repeat protein (TIGR03803 family)